MFINDQIERYFLLFMGSIESRSCSFAHVENPAMYPEKVRAGAPRILGALFCKQPVLNGADLASQTGLFALVKNCHMN